MVVITNSRDSRIREVNRAVRIFTKMMKRGTHLLLHLLLHLQTTLRKEGVVILQEGVESSTHMQHISKFNENKWWNRFPQNPTQTMYLRFKKSPTGEFNSMFTKNTFNSKLKNPFEGGKL